jgi:glycosyltransferase involved in cell wall biosynthesis
MTNRIIETARFRFSDIVCLRRFAATTRNNVRHIQSCYRRHPYQALKNLRDWTKSTISLYEKYRNKYGDPSIILVFSAVWSGYAASEISKLYGVPYVLTEHRSRFTGLRQEALDMIKQAHLPFLESAYGQASEIISVSDSLINCIQDYGGERDILTIPNLVLTDYFVPPESRQRDPFVILSAGRLETEKGMDILIQAFDLFASDNPGSELRIVGRGPVEPDLKTMASRTFDPDRIKFLGNLSRKDLLREMQHASMLALTSRFEAFGLVMAEAMSTGLPVLSTRSGGPDSILPGYAGILVDCESVPAVFVGLKNMYNRYTEFQPEKIRKFAIRRFGKKVIMKCYKLVLDTVLARASGPPPETEKLDKYEHVPEEIKREVSLKSKVKTVSKSTGQAAAMESERSSKETVLAGD